MTQGKKQVSALCGTAVVEGLASEERFAEITSGRSPGQQGLVATCQDSWNEAVAEGRESPVGLAQESVVAETEGQRPQRRQSRFPILVATSRSGKGTVDTWRFHCQRGCRTQSRRYAVVWVERDCGQTTEVGVHANQRLSLAEAGKAHGGKAKVSNRTREIWPSGIIGGPRETGP